MRMAHYPTYPLILDRIDLISSRHRRTRRENLTSKIQKPHLVKQVAQTRTKGKSCLLLMMNQGQPLSCKIISKQNT